MWVGGGEHFAFMNQPGAVAEERADLELYSYRLGLNQLPQSLASFTCLNHLPHSLASITCLNPLPQSLASYTISRCSDQEL
jgi:hypothetical protein